MGSPQRAGAGDSAWRRAMGSPQRAGAGDVAENPDKERADFWPLGRYRAKFGSLEKTFVFEGIEGVLVPSR